MNDTNTNESVSFNGTSFTLAPGAERGQNAVAALLNNNNNNNVELPGTSGLKPVVTQATTDKDANGKLIMNYSTDFPKLPDAPPPTPAVGGAWARQPGIKSSEITEVFKLSSNERASRGLGKQFGNVSEEQQKCNSVALATNTKIEVCEAKDQSLTILITGKRNNVNDAHNRLVRELQTQASVEVSIPKEFHGHIIGSQGSKLRSLETEFLSRIHMPGRDEKSDVIRIVGPNEYIGNAARRIREIGDEIAKQGNETLNIPREFYPWIRGPFNETLDSITANAPSVKVNIPPPSSKNQTIIVTGERQEVELVARKICEIYESRKATNKMVTIKVARPQHRFIIGTKRSGIEEILRETNVVVEIPPEGEQSDSITLRGPPERLGDALSLVYSKASSVISQEIRYQEWMRRFLIGPKGSRLQELVPNQEKLKIDLDDSELIYLEGAPDAVKAAATALTGEVERLQKEMSSETIKVPPNFHRHIIGKNGAVVNKFKDENDVQITIPNEKNNSDEIRIEGKKEGVKKTVAEIRAMVHRLENEKTVEINIEQRFHGQIIGKNGENTNKWRKEFPTVSITFPDASDKSHTVILRGDCTEVDKLHPIISKLAKEILENSYKETVSISKEFYKHIIGKAGSNINKIRDETQTRIELPAEGDSLVTVTGKKANVQKAIRILEETKLRAEELDRQAEERKLRSHKISIDVPLQFHQRLIGSGGSRVKDLTKRYDVQISIPRTEDNSTAITISGFETKCEECKKEIEKYVNDLESMISQEIRLDQRFHPRVIGAKGRNLRKLEDEFGVEIAMPARNATEPELVVITGRNEDSVYDCADKLKRMEDEFIADLVDRNVYTTQNTQPKEEERTVQQVEITGAPWQLDNMEQFPAMGGVSNDGQNSNNGIEGQQTQHQPAVSAGVWGNRRW